MNFFSSVSNSTTQAMYTVHVRLDQCMHAYMLYVHSKTLNRLFVLNTHTHAQKCVVQMRLRFHSGSCKTGFVNWSLITVNHQGDPWGERCVRGLSLSERSVSLKPPTRCWIELTFKVNKGQTEKREAAVFVGVYALRNQRLLLFYSASCCKCVLCSCQCLSETLHQELGGVYISLLLACVQWFHKTLLMCPKLILEQALLLA